MGNYLSNVSGDDKKRYDYIADSLQESFKEHGNNLEALEETNEILVAQLLRCRDSQQTTEGVESRTEEQNKNIETLSKIQSLHFAVLTTNFKHLKRCLYHTIESCTDTNHLSTIWKNLLWDLYAHSDKRGSSSATDKTSEESSDRRVPVKTQPDTSRLIDIELEKLQERIDSLEERITSYQSKNDDVSFEKKVRKKEKEIKKLKDDLENVHRNHQEDLAKMAKMNQNIESLKETVSLKDEEIKRESRSRDEYIRRCNSLEQQKGNLNQEIWRLKDEIRKMAEKPKVPIQLYYVRNDNLMTSVVNELNAMLRTHPSLMGVNLEIQQCTKPDDVAAGSIVLTLCINASRLGTDAASAISGIKGTNKMALLVFHHKDMHAIPTQRSERMLTGAEFRNLGGIYDLVFLQGKGIYACDYNNKALDSIAAFIKG